MKRFVQRHPGPELMDAPDVDPNDLRRNLYELEVINRLLGGHRCTFQGLRHFNLKPGPRYRILDVGCGGGDTLRAISNWGRRNNLDLDLAGIDLSETAVNYARETCSSYPNISITQSSFEDLCPEENFDIVLCSLFTHHFYGDQLKALIQMMDRCSTRGFTINDLERNGLAYWGIYLLTRLFSSSHLVKYDAPLSVWRGFKKQEWISLLNEFGHHEAVVENVWAFRHAITFVKHA